MAHKILVVDDEEDVRETIKVRLDANGYDVVMAADGAQGLAKVKEESPDVIILDVMMPDMNGFQVCRQLKDDPNFKNIPVILLTAKATESDQFWGIEAGADMYVSKPFNGQELVGKVEELLSNK